MTKIAVVLSGAGVFDGAEINESVLTLLHIEKSGAQYQCFAPNIEQFHALNHLNGEVQTELRNVLQESARIVRGNVKPLNELKLDDFDALILPGGFGVAKNFCDFALSGAKMSINSEIFSVCHGFAMAKKPAGYMCIAPVLLPHIYGEGVRCTIGNDNDVASAISKMGGKHEECEVDDIVIDDNFMVVTTPAYMLAESISDAEKGISKLVAKVIQLAK